MVGLLFEPITDCQWDAYAGAEPFSDGRRPMFANIIVDGHLADVVWCAGGVDIFWSVPDGSVTCASFAAEMDLNPELLLSSMTTETLRRVGARITEGL